MLRRRRSQVLPFNMKIAVFKTINRSILTVLLLLTLVATVALLQLILQYQHLWKRRSESNLSMQIPEMNAVLQVDELKATIVSDKVKKNTDFKQIQTATKRKSERPKVLVSQNPSRNTVTKGHKKSKLKDDNSKERKETILQDYHERTMTYRKQFNCETLLHGDRAEQENFVKFWNGVKGSFPVLTTQEAMAVTSDCEAFKRVRDYRSDTGTELEQNFPLAYVILVHMDFEHLERLLRSLYMPQHSFCIHVDDKAPESLKQAITSLVKCFPNVILASRPQKIVYAHVSRLMADIQCMEDLIKLGKPWKYLLNYAATEFPLRSNIETVGILDSLHGLNDIHEQYKKRVEKRFDFEYHIIGNKMRMSKQRLAPPPYNLTVIKGQAYNSFSREFLEWVLTDKKPREFLQWSSKTYSPDEHFWATLNNLYHNPFLNSPGGFKGDPDRKGYLTRYINWQYDHSKVKCYGKVVRHICVLNALDLPNVISRRKLAVNKFDLTFDPIAYSCVEEFNESKSKSSISIDLGYYKNMYFVRFSSQ